MRINTHYYYMNTLIQSIEKLVLTAGHGGRDVGAYDSRTQRAERDNNTYIAKKIYAYSQQYPIPNLEVELWDAENQYALAEEITRLNARFPFSFAQKKILITSFHQDMFAPHLPIERQKWQVGTYYYTNDKASEQVAKDFTQEFIKNGAYNATPENQKDFNGAWYREHYLPDRKFFLGFIHRIKAFSLIFEMGYISGNHTNEELDKLASIWYQSFYFLKTGRELAKNQQIVENDDMAIKKKLLEEIQAESRYDDNTKNMLINAVYGEDANHLLDMSGASIREENLKLKENLEKMSDSVTRLNLENERLYKAYQLLQQQTSQDMQYEQSLNNQVSARPQNFDFLQKITNALPKFQKFEGEIKNEKGEVNKRFIEHTSKSLIELSVALITFIVATFTNNNTIIIAIVEQALNHQEVYAVIFALVTSVFSLASVKDAISALTDFVRKDENDK